MSANKSPCAAARRALSANRGPLWASKAPLRADNRAIWPDDQPMPATHRPFLARSTAQLAVNGIPPTGVSHRE